MIRVGKILAYIRKHKDFKQSALIARLKEYRSEGQIRDIEAGRTAYIDPPLLFAWLEFLELQPNECEFLVQENVRCSVRSELEQIKVFKVRPQILAAIADLGALLTRGKPIEILKVIADVNKHNLPYLLIRPPYIDAVVTSINKDSQ